MNILFLLKSFGIGGVEVVSSVLANKFVTQGHNVVIWVFLKNTISLANRLDNRIKIIYGSGFKYSKQNVKALRELIIENQIQIAINQWGLHYIPTLVLKKASYGLNIKIIAAYHNDPNTNGQIKRIETSIKRSRSSILTKYLTIKLHFFKYATAASMRYVYHCSNKFLVLSPSFINHFKDFTGMNNTPKLTVQTNPLTINNEYTTPDLFNKQKEIIYVGRIDYYQKRTYRVIETWALLENKYPEWTLRIIGDGEDKTSTEELCKKLNLHRVHFEGFKQPLEFYRRASILILTSEYEGFGLVIVEGMSFGVVPVVYGSYSAVYDIIKDGENGLIVKPQNGEFKAEAMAKALEQAMTDEDKRHDMAEKAIATSQNYSLDVIYKQWEGLFNDLK